MNQDKKIIIRFLEKMIEPFYSANVEADEKYVSVYDDDVIDLEAFSRMLLGLGPLLYNTPNNKYLDTALCKIANGVDPANKSYWGIKNTMNQMHVEMFSIAFFLYSLRSQIPESFFKKNSENIRNWLISINIADFPQNNWLLFKVMINCLLYKLNMIDLDWEIIRELQDQIDELYLEDGLYSDGATTRIDYYNSFAFHFYSLLYCVIMEEDIEVCEKYKQRALQFANIYKLFFSDNGKMIPYGRSLTYRFGALAFWSAALYSRDDRFDKKYIKWLLYTSIEEWMKQDIFDENGYLNLGFYYRNHLLVEDYSSYGSPYWAFKYFIFLYLGDDDDFWYLDYSQPLTNNEKYFSKYIHIEKHDGYSYLYPCSLEEENVEFSHFQDKYAKFCYTNLFGFNISKGMGALKEIALDSSIAVGYDNRFFISKNHVKITKNDDGTIKSTWRVNPHACITSYVCPFGEWHTRVHIVCFDNAIYFVEGGFPIDSIGVKKEENSIILSNRLYSSRLVSNVGNALLSQMSLYPNSNVYSRKTCIPIASYYIEKGCHVVVNSFYAGVKLSDNKDLPNVRVNKNEIHIEYRGLVYNLDVKANAAKNFKVHILKELKNLYSFIRRFGV